MTISVLLSAVLSGFIAQATPRVAPQAEPASGGAANAVRRPAFPTFSLTGPGITAPSRSRWLPIRFASRGLSTRHEVPSGGRGDSICTMVVIHPPTDLDPGMRLPPQETGAAIRRIEPPCRPADSGEARK